MPWREGEEIPEAVKKEIFEALVVVQDEGKSVVESRLAITKKFGVNDAQIRSIEREGLNKLWPPL